MAEEKNILFVCGANACRSPMAETYARVIAGWNGLPLSVSSAGLSADEGAEPFAEAVRCAGRFLPGALEHRRTSSLTREQAERADLIVCANTAQRVILGQMLPGVPVTCFAPAAPDPVGRGEEAFEECMNTMALQMYDLIAPLTGREVLIRPAVADDVTAIAGLENETFPTPFARSHFAMSLYEPSRLLLAAQTGRGIAGYLLARVLPDEPPAAEILTVAVAERERQKGVGRALMTALSRALTERSVSRSLLEVRESNTPAQKLYARCGYRQIGRRRGYYDHPDEDALIMEKTL